MNHQHRDWGPSLRRICSPDQRLDRYVEGLEEQQNQVTLQLDTAWQSAPAGTSDGGALWFSGLLSND